MGSSKLETAGAEVPLMGLAGEAGFEDARRKFSPRAALSHVGLLVALVLYTAGGGFVFRALEYPAERAKVEFHQRQILEHRELFVQTINETRDVLNFETVIRYQLEKYEEVLENASNSGIQLLAKTDFSPAEDKWSVSQSVFFSSTVLTTIGYGNIVPVTFWGRLFCIAYALIGIPLTLTVIADLGSVFATAVSMLGKKNLLKIPKVCRVAASGDSMPWRSVYALSAVCFLFVYLSAGAGLFTLWEEDWSFGDGFYFCFVTMTTIGFGDLVPKEQSYMLLCTLYILIGLALTSTIIELVRRQYVRSWEQLRALSGPLADTLRRLGDAGMGVDVSSLHNDLRKVLTVVTMPRLHGGREGISEKSQLEWEAAVEAVIRDITAPKPENKKPPIVQIVIYESSV